VRAEVPTWNYAAVHARGATRLLHDEDEKRRILRTLVGANEVDRVARAAAPERERRYATDEVEEPVMRTQLARIVFFEMLVEHFDGKLKLSQNKSDRDQHSVANALAAGALGAAGRDVADLMRAHCPALRAQKR
jgi:transcriptional regulator